MEDEDDDDDDDDDVGDVDVADDDGEEEGEDDDDDDDDEKEGKGTEAAADGAPTTGLKKCEVSAGGFAAAAAAPANALPAMTLLVRRRMRAPSARYMYLPLLRCRSLMRCSLPLSPPQSTGPPTLGSAISTTQ